jgi:hypothetical protein
MPEGEAPLVTTPETRVEKSVERPPQVLTNPQMTEQSNSMRTAYAYAAAFAYYRFTLLDAPPIKRATEEIQVTNETLRRAITIDLATPESAALGNSSIDPPGMVNPGEVILPLTAAPRGRLLDSFEVSALAVPVLPRSEAKKLSQIVLSIAWDQAFGENWREDRTRFTRLDPIRSRVLHIPMRPMHASLSLVAEIRDLLRGLPSGIQVDYHGFHRLNALLSYFSKRTIIWVRVAGSPGERFTLRYSYEHSSRNSGKTLPRVALPRWDGDLRGLLSRPWVRARYLLSLAAVLIGSLNRSSVNRELLRAWIGQIPNELRIPVGMLHLAESYHLYVDAPSAHYVSRQRLLVGNRSVRSDAAPIEVAFKEQLANGADYRIGGTSLGTKAHLYTYRMVGVPGRPVTADVRFTERPPGSTGLALTIGKLIFVLNLFVLIAFPELIDLSYSAVDVVAIVLSIPVFATLWLGRTLTSDGDSYARTPILTRAAFGGFGGAAVLSAIALMLAISTRGAAGPNYIGAWGSEHYYWNRVSAGAACSVTLYFLIVLQRRRRNAFLQYRDMQEAMSD